MSEQIPEHKIQKGRFIKNELERLRDAVPIQIARVAQLETRVAQLEAALKEWDDALFSINDTLVAREDELYSATLKLKAALAATPATGGRT